MNPMTEPLAQMHIADMQRQACRYRLVRTGRGPVARAHAVREHRPRRAF